MPQRGGQPPLFGITEAAMNAVSSVAPSFPIPLGLLGGGKKKRKKASKKRRKRRTSACRCAPRCKCRPCKCNKKRSKRKSRRRNRRSKK